jgi:uncharacterized membrane protein YbhN (UPF0104 family)
VNRRALPPVSGVEQGTLRRPPPGERAARGREAGIDATWWRWARPVGGALILGAVLARLGTGAVTDALRATDVPALAVGAVIALVTTVCGAWRWRLVASRLDVDLRMPAAVAACYRAQFLNVVLPGGVLGDVDRGVHHGREVDDLGRGLRAVAWERTSGQVVLVLVTVSGLALAQPFTEQATGLSAGPAATITAGVALAAVLIVVAAVRAARRERPGRWGRVWRVAAADARALASPRTVVGIVLASVVAVVGHTLTFLVAARAVGVAVPVVDLVPVVLVVLLVSAVPLNLAGWGPREGAAAWGFAAVGLGASQGLATAVAYGAIVFVATLPGAVLLLLGRSRRSTRVTDRSGRRPADAAVVVAPVASPASTVGEVGAHG